MASEYKEKNNGEVAYTSPVKNTSGFNTDSSDGIEPAGAKQGLHRQLKNRHVAMISLAGVIGVGIFVNTVSPPL